MPDPSEMSTSDYLSLLAQPGACAVSDELDFLVKVPGKEDLFMDEIHWIDLKSDDFIEEDGTKDERGRRISRITEAGKNQAKHGAPFPPL